MTPWHGVVGRQGKEEAAGAPTAVAVESEKERWGLDEKNHWCIVCAALLFSLMFPLLSADEAVSGNHACTEEPQRR